MSGMKERELEDGYPIYGDYFYIVDGKVYRSDFHGITARDLKRRLRASIITNCDIYGRGGFEACARAAHSPQATEDAPNVG